MDYCLYNAIKTPDGTVLWCQSGHDYQTHEDKVSGETYMNDGVGYSIRRSVNTVPFDDLSVWSTDPHEKVRKAPFWGSYGKDGKSPKKMMSLSEMEDEHITAILKTQRQIAGTEVEKLFVNEIEYRREKFAHQLELDLPNVNNKKRKMKT